MKQEYFMAIQVIGYLTVALQQSTNPPPSLAEKTKKGSGRGRGRPKGTTKKGKGKKK
jgi:hypothetical protein